MWYGEYAKVPMDCNWNAMSHRWRAIQAERNKFHGDLEQIQRRKESGKTVLTDATTLYRENNDHKDFKFMHCLVKLQNNKK